MIENSSFLLGLGVRVMMKWWWWWGVRVWYQFGKVGRVLPDNFSLPPGRPGGRDNFSLSSGLNCTAAAASERNEGTTFSGFELFNKMFWYTQRFGSKWAPETIFVCGNCCLFRCLLLSASVLGGRQTNHPAFFLHIKISIMKKKRRRTDRRPYMVLRLCDESDFWGSNWCWPVIDFS